MSDKRSPPFLASRDGELTGEARARDGSSRHDGGMPPDERVARLEAIIPTLATKADMAELRGDMHEMNAGISRWMLGTVLAVISTVVLGFVGLGLNLASTLKQPPAQQQPTVIVMPAAAAPTPPASDPLGLRQPR